MGIIKAAADLVKGNLGDQWLEVYEAENMGDQTVFTRCADPSRTEHQGNRQYGIEWFRCSCL